MGYNLGDVLASFVTKFQIDPFQVLKTAQSLLKDEQISMFFLKIQDGRYKATFSVFYQMVKKGNKSSLAAICWVDGGWAGVLSAEQEKPSRLGNSVSTCS